MPFIAPAITAIGSAIGNVGLGGLLSAGGAVFSGISQSRASAYQARVAEMNQKIANDNAVRAQQRSQVEQMTQDRQTAAMLGEQRAAMAGSGLDLNSSSFIRTRAATQELGRLDALNVRQGGDLETFNYRVDAAGQGASAQLARMEGRNALVSSVFSAGQSLIGGSSSSGARNRIVPRTRTRTDPWITRSGTNLRRVTI